jgi:hypothetical protein
MATATMTGPQSKPPASPPPADKDDICNILTSDEIATLKRGYDRDAMNQAAIAAVAGPYQPGTDFVKFIVDHFYDPERWPPDQREQCMISLLTPHCVGQGLLLAVHLYWGLMEGLSAHQIADTILLAGAYSGIPNFTNGIGTLRTTLMVCKQQANTGNAGDANCLAVVHALAQTYALPTGPTMAPK